MRISELLAEIKNNKALDQPTHELLKQELKLNNVKLLKLWNMSGAYRFVLGFARFQLYAVAAAAFTIFPYIMYQKYLEDTEKAQILAVTTPVASLIMLAPIVYFRKFSRKLLTSIAYDIPHNKFVFQEFGGKKVT